MSRAHISKAEIALWGSVSSSIFFSCHTNSHLRRPCIVIDRIEHVKQVQKAKTKAVKTSKKKVKDVTHKVVDVITPNSLDPESWKKDIMEGRRKRIGNSEEADGTANSRRTETEQPRQVENVYGQATEPTTDNFQKEREHGETPGPDLAIVGPVLECKTPVLRETIARAGIVEPAGEPHTNAGSTDGGR
jgi:hypothetical protein